MHTSKKRLKNTPQPNKLVAFKMTNAEFNKLSEKAKANQRSVSAQIRWALDQLAAG